MENAFSSKENDESLAGSSPVRPTSFKRPSGYVTTGFNEYRRYDHLDDGRVKVVIFKCGKEVRSYVEDPCKPAPWWKFWGY